MEPQQADVKKVPEYIPPAIQCWTYWRTAAEPYRVFHVVGIDGFSGDFTAVVRQEWGKLEPQAVPYDNFIKAVKEGQLLPFRPDPLQYIFINPQQKTA